MTEPKLFKFDTLALHAGQQPDPATGARAVPIYQTTSYVFADADQAASLFNLERAGHIYSRISNPTVAVLEERVAALEGGVGAVATASGQAALHLAIVTLMDAGSHIVASKSLYGGSTNLFKLTLPRFGIETSFVDPRDPDAFAAAIRPETRLLFAETIGNPGLEVLDIPDGRRGRAPPRPAAPDRQHLRHAVPVPAVRARRRSGAAFGDQVARRPRPRDRRHPGRRRPLRLAGARANFRP